MNDVIIRSECETRETGGIEEVNRITMLTRTAQSSPILWRYSNICNGLVQ